MGPRTQWRDILVPCPWPTSSCSAGSMTPRRAGRYGYVNRVAQARLRSTSQVVITGTGTCRLFADACTMSQSCVIGGAMDCIIWGSTKLCWGGEGCRGGKGDRISPVLHCIGPDTVRPSRLVGSQTARQSGGQSNQNRAWQIDQGPAKMATFHLPSTVPVLLCLDCPLTM